MKKKAFTIFTAVILTLQLCISAMEPAYAAEREEIPQNELYSKSCALTDGDSDRLLYGKEENLPLANASTTKIMTCILALEYGGLDEVVTASGNAAAQPKVHLGMQEKEQFYLRDLLYGLMLESYNDCAYAIAEHIGGSVENFVSQMNAKAKEIGCTDTHFVTPNGLDQTDDEGDHHTTAVDLCRIMSYCTWKSPQCEDFLSITETREYSFFDLEGKSFSVSNKNALLDQMDCVLTGKTGFTSQAGYCYVAAAEESGRRFCIALLACGWPNNKNYKWADAKKLFQFGLDHYHLYEEKQAKEPVPLVVGGAYQEDTLDEWGQRMRLPLYIERKGTKLRFLKADWDEAKVVYSYVHGLKAPVGKGQCVGKISYVVGNQEMYAYGICAKEGIHQWNFTAFLHALWKEIT